MTAWHSYPKIFALGHGAIKELLFDDVTVEEKVDGSQFSFGVFDGQLKCRSKGQQIHLDAPEKMFLKGVETAVRLTPVLREGWMYSGEFLNSVRHNIHTHERVPAGHVILFDIRHGEEEYLSYQEKKTEAERIGLEVVPLLYEGRIDDISVLMDFLKRDSVLGGTKIEGFVVKNYGRFGADKKILMGKFVSEAFKEIHGKLWKDFNPKQGDICEQLVLRYRTVARWQKAVRHLADDGVLTDSPKDIGPLIKEVQADIKKECEDEIKKILFDWAWDQLGRRLAHGLPQWYKERLLEKQFEAVGSDEILTRPQALLQARNQAQDTPSDPSDSREDVV